MGWPIDMEWEGCESIECWTHVVTFNIHHTHDLDLRFSRSNFWKCFISGMGWLNDLDFKGYESIECWTHVMTFNVHLNHDLDLGFSRSNFLIAIDRNGRAHHHRSGMGDHGITLTLGGGYWNWCISGMGGSTHLEWKGCELDMMLDAQWYWPWAVVHGR